MTPEAKTPSPKHDDLGLPEVYRRFSEMAMMVPESDDSDANARILEQLLGAQTPGDLSKPWEAENSKGLDGREVEIQSITRRPSDFKDGLGIFLVCDAVDVKTGEAFVFTTGSVGVVGQLVMAWAREWFPVHCIIRQAERPTKKGYFPLHLEPMDDFTAPKS